MALQESGYAVEANSHDGDESRGMNEGDSEQGFEDLDMLASLLDEDIEEAGETVEVRTPDQTNTSAADLGLVLSDDEEDQATTSNSDKSKFSAAFSGSKFSRKVEKQNCPSAEDAGGTIDPLELELQQMEQRVKLLRKNLTKKRRLDSEEGSSSRKFTKLTSVVHEPKHSVKVLSDMKESKLYNSIKKRSDLHTGDTDSEDEEDHRNPFEQRYNTFGREIRKRISHEPNPRSVQRTDVLQRDRETSSHQKPGWKGASGSLVPLKTTPGSSPSCDKNVSVDQYSGIRFVNPKISGDVMRERMEGRKMVRMSTITLHLRGGEIEGDWVTIGVVVDKSASKTSQKGSQYSIWTLSDLSDCTKSVALFLFAGAYKHLWKTAVGTVIGILNPSIMKDRQGDKSSHMITLSVADHQKIMEMGSSKDLGWCRGMTQKGSKCKYFVNKSSCEFCIYHIQREYQKTSAKRADIQSSFTRVDPRRKLQEKVLGKNQVFYGGQLYSSSTSSHVPKQQRANKSKDLATLNSLKLKMKTEELKAEDKQKSFVLKHMSDSEVEAIKQVAEKNDSFTDKLLAPTPGARNLLRHMTKETTQKKITTGEVVSVSAKDLLSMTHRQIQSRKKEQQHSLLREPSLSPAAEPSRMPSVSPTAGPKLCRGVQPGDTVDLDFSLPPRKSDMAKARAKALLQKKGIQAKDPNSVKNSEKAANPKFQKKVQERLNKSSDSESGDKCKSRLAEAVLAESSRSKLGSVDVNSDKFKAMVEQKSRHTNLVDVVENEAMEKYYQGLEKKEMLENKMSSVMEIPTTAYVCVTCKYMAESASDFCREEDHPLKSVKVKKRFFECKNCKQRTTTLDKLPRKSCAHCYQSSWQRVAMGKEKKGPKLDSEVLSLRGDELKHYSASSNQVFLHI